MASEESGNGRAGSVAGYLARVGRALRDAGRAQEQMWARLELVDPDPWERLHWEPTASGWRLAGSLLPDEPGDLNRRRPSG